MSENNIAILSNMYCTATKEQVDIIKQLSLTKNNVIQELSMAGIPFTWETVTDFAISDDTRVLEIRLYIPGNILYGRTTYHSDNSSNKIAHEIAIYEAMKCVVSPKSETVQTPQPVQQETPIQQEAPVQPQSNITQPLSSDEIMNFVQQQAAATVEPQAPQPITTAEQFTNDPREEVPYDEVNMDDNELEKLLSGTPNTPAPAPQQKTMGFTQEQIQKMITFKQKFNITTDEVLCTYINAWNNKLSKKEDLTAENIDAFLQWTDMLGKAPY